MSQRIVEWTSNGNGRAFLDSLLDEGWRVVHVVAATAQPNLLFGTHVVFCAVLEAPKESSDA